MTVARPLRCGLLLFRQVANEADQPFDLIVRQLALVRRHLRAFAVRNAVGQLRIRLLLHRVGLQVVTPSVFPMGTSPLPSGPWQAAHLDLKSAGASCARSGAASRKSIPMVGATKPTMRTIRTGREFICFLLVSIAESSYTASSPSRTAFKMHSGTKT